MPLKSEILMLSKLNLKKFRDSENKFIVEGKRFVSEGIKSKFNCLQILITNEFEQKDFEYCNYLGSQNKKISKINTKDFTKISSTKNPQGVAAVFEIPEKSFSSFKNDEIIICLENISDPGNVGTILRSCDWFGVKTVLLSNDCAELYNPKVLRASMGAIFNLKIFENINLIEKLGELKKANYKIYFANMNGTNYSQINYKQKSVITFCNEAFGPTKELKDVCDEAITIPKKGNIESLNVSAAAAVILSKLL
ncbi:MAG: RNA methyltransferase [Ignavibacteriales bacterium]|nr:RNA methyltransferase [Ignavibacteriales bacterium]